MTSPTTRSGLSPGAFKTILIGSGILALIFGLILLVGGISTIGGSVGAGVFSGLATTMSSVTPVAYILFAVAVLCLAYAYNLRSGYIAGGCLIGLAVVGWIFTRAGSLADVLILGIAMAALALLVGIFTDRTVTDTAPLMGAPELALKGGRLILLFGIFSLAGILMQLSSYVGAGSAMLVCGFALTGTAALLGGLGGILLFVAFLKVYTKRTPTAPRAAAPLKEEAPVKPAPPRLKPAQVEQMVYGYIVDHGGEIDIDKCTRDLKISKSDVEKAVKSLVKKGKLETG